MAVPEQTPYIEYTANGVATSFELGFDCKSKDHLIVTLDGVEPPVGGWSLTDGAVVFGTAPNDGKKITIQRNTPFSRNTDYQSYNNSFRPHSVNGDFDRVWLKLQELGVTDWLLRLYVDRLHGEQKTYIDKKDAQLQQNIDNLKTYVDDKDDELRAYLLEEIRKQGVALDQLDDYYNYLMQRLAQIAVQGGWEASFVVDASGKTQQEINYLSQNIRDTEFRLLDFIPRNLHSKIKDYTSLADVSAYVQVAIDEVSGLGGGTILIPNGMIWAYVTLKDSVQLVGANSHARPFYKNNVGTVWRNADDAFSSVVTPSTGISACGIAGIQFRGKSANSVGAVRFGDTFGASLKNCSFNTFKDEAFIAEGLVGTYEDLIAVNTLLQRERTERTGCFKFLGADHYISKIEGNTGITGVINPDLNLAGIYVGGSNHYADKLMGELSEVGIFVTSSGAAHKITTSRADLNFGHGWLLGGGNSNLVGCHAHNNSNKSNGVYSGFKAVESSVSQNKLIGCFGTTTSGFAHKFDFDLVGTDIDTPSSRGGLWICKGTRNLPVYHGSLGSQQTGLIRTNSANPVTTVNVDNSSTIRLEHDLYGLTGGSVGQRVSIIPSIAGLRLKHSNNFQLAGGYITPSNERILAVGRIYTFEQILPNTWREIPNATPLAGDSSLRPNATSITGSLYYDTSLDRPICRNAANNAFVNALGGQLSKPIITGELSPTTISEQNAVLSSIVSALVAAGEAIDGRA